jgi:hypothetical protein
VIFPQYLRIGESHPSHGVPWRALFGRFVAI